MENMIFYVEPLFDLFRIRYLSSKQVYSIISLFIYIFNYIFILLLYRGLVSPAYITCYLLLLVITLLLLLLALLLLLLLSLLLLLLLLLSLIPLCYLCLFLQRATSSFCSPTTATFIVSGLLFFELICNHMGIIFFKKNVSIILKHCLLFLY